MSAGAAPGAVDAAPMSFQRIAWSAPWFEPFAERGRRWQQAALRGERAMLAELNADAAALPGVTGRERRLAFIPQQALPAGAAYEAHIAATGCVPTRHNLHDFFNALVWFAFPRVKAALNARQAAALDALGVGPTRGAERDALTLFDENAVLFVCAEPALSHALRNFDWRTLFVQNRSAWQHRCEARAFGHALLEKLLAPYKACTAHAWIAEVSPDYFDWPRERRDAWLDEAIAADLRAGALRDSRRFATLPVLGIPGWWPGNADPSFYDDAVVFRPGRRVRC